MSKPADEMVPVSRNQLNKLAADLWRKANDLCAEYQGVTDPDEIEYLDSRTELEMGNVKDANLADLLTFLNEVSDEIEALAGE
jgi:hypothetical protein